MRIEENVPLAPHTTFRLGGPARYFSCIKTVEELRQSLDFSKSRNLELLLLGGGADVEIKGRGRWVEVLDRHSGEVVRMESAACGFGYRTSIFKRLPAQAG